MARSNTERNDMRAVVPSAAAFLVFVALFPLFGMSQENEDGLGTSLESSRSLLLPLPWGESADTWGYAVTFGASLLTFLLGRRLLRRD